jgi:LysM repeat protein
LATPSQQQFFVQGKVVGTATGFTAQFDSNYTPISNQYPGTMAPSVIVQSGDTLSTIAARIWGDASLWYLIAQENGLSDPNYAPPPGTELKLPNAVTTLKNNASTFKPYDLGRVLGNTTPTQPFPPPPSDNGCGIFGQILMAVSCWFKGRSIAQSARASTSWWARRTASVGRKWRCPPLPARSASKP